MVLYTKAVQSIGAAGIASMMAIVPVLDLPGAAISTQLLSFVD